MLSSDTPKATAASRATTLPTRMAANLTRLEQAAWPLFRAGHLPMIGEWVALPVLDSAGGLGPLDPLAAEVLYPTAERLLAHCDGVLRLPGASTGADEDVRIARERGLPVWFDLADVPGVEQPGVQMPGAEPQVAEITPADSSTSKEPPSTTR